VKVIYTQDAIQDLLDAYEYLIGRGDIQRAGRIDAAIARVAEQLARRDFEGPVMTLKSGKRVRSWPSPPYRVITHATKMCSSFFACTTRRENP